ncbi:MAG: hypothetical protein ACREFE_14670 [Limisphaerales bacterium]
MKFILLHLSFLIVIAQTLCFGQTNLALALFLKREKPPAYQAAMLKVLLAEANDYVAALNLPEKRPLTKDSIKDCFIGSPYVAEHFGGLGSFQTTNFSYGFGKGKHLCYITRIIKGDNPFDYNANKRYAIDPSEADTNAAYSMATQFLAKAFVNVSQLSTSSVVSVEPWVILHMTTSKYTVEWRRGDKPVVKVVLAVPKDELWTLRVEDPNLILRKPLQITNLDYLLSQTNVPPVKK